MPARPALDAGAKRKPEPPMSSPVAKLKPSVQDIMVYVMVATSAADGRMSDPELKSIGIHVQSLPVFEGYGDDDFMAAVRDCTQHLDAEDGLDTIIQMAAGLPQRLQETAYALAVDVAAADLMVAPEEVRLLQMMRDELRLDRLATAAIERGAKARHQSP